VFRLIEYFIARSLLAVLQAVSYRTCLRLARRIGRLAYVLDRPHRRRTLEHLRLAYGEGRSDLDRIARQVFETMALHVAEFVHLPRRGFRGLRLENAEILERARDRGRGIVIVSAHHGPFGLLGLVARTYGVRATVVLKRQKNDRLLTWAIGQIDRHFGVEVVLKHDAREQAGEVLRGGQALVLFADQHPIAGGIPATFFGRPIEAAAGPTVFARRLDCPLLVLTSWFGPDGVPRARVDGPVPTDGTPEEVSQRWISLLEARIREHPEQWMWMHRRWRNGARP
jgi:KDO2-lipid IV(A) lauroyltransferase